MLTGFLSRISRPVAAVRPGTTDGHRFRLASVVVSWSRIIQLEIAASLRAMKVLLSPGFAVVAEAAPVRCW
jgi:hypothetical protein